MSRITPYALGAIGAGVLLLAVASHRLYAAEKFTATLIVIVLAILLGKEWLTMQLTPKK